MTCAIKQSKRIMAIAFLCAALIALATCLAPAKAHAAAAEHANTSGNTSLVAVAKSGNCDKFIGLKSYQWVMAIAKSPVKVHKSASNSSSVIGKFKRNCAVVVDTSKMKAGKDYKWLKVKLKGSARGYIPTSKVRLKVLDTKTFGLDTSTKEGARRLKICSCGLPYIGTTYKSSGKSMKTGLACPLFAKKCLRKGGIKATKAKVSYFAKFGKAEKRSDLKPGDLVLYSPSDKTKKPSHVTIYIGNDFIINSSAFQGKTYPSGGIRISHIDYRKPIMFRNPFVRAKK